MASIHNAARNGNLNRVRELLDRGAPVNARGVDGRTPLHNAAFHGQANVVRELLGRGARVNPRNKNGVTPLHLAATSGYENIVRELLDRGVPVNTRTTTGWTPLHWAAYMGHENAVRELIERGAHANARDRNGETPLDLTGTRRYRVREILSHGARVNTPTPRPTTTQRTRTVHRVASKWLRGPVQFVPLPNNAPKAPISLHNFKKGHEAIRHTRRNASGRSANRYYTVKEFQNLAGKSWSTIYRMKPSNIVVEKDPMNRRRIYRRELNLVRFT